MKIKIPWAIPNAKETTCSHEIKSLFITPDRAKRLIKLLQKALEALEEE